MRAPLLIALCVASWPLTSSAQQVRVAIVTAGEEAIPLAQRLEAELSLAGRQLGVEALERQALAHHLVADLVHRPHPAFTKKTDEAVLPVDDVADIHEPTSGGDLSHHGIGAAIG